MDALAAYGSDDDDDDFGVSATAAAVANVEANPFGHLAAAVSARDGAAANGSATSLPNAAVEIGVNLTPDVLVEDLRMVVPFHNPASKTIAYNATYEALYAPVQGPQPVQGQSVGQKNHASGNIEADAMHYSAFEEQRNTFLRLGYAMDPSADAAGSRRVIGNTREANRLGGISVINDLPKSTDRKKRKMMGDAAEEPFTYDGPWAGYEGERVNLPKPETVEAAVAQGSGAAPQPVEPGTEEDKIYGPGVEKTIFHGKTERDYLGRTYMDVPKDVDVNLSAEPGSQECFLPKRLAHVWTGHTKGVSAIRFFPKSAHLLLSCSMDSKIKIWDVYHNRQCLRTYMGHSKAVRDVCFSNDGRQFLSASYDRFIKLWDTETGKCLGSYTNKKVPYCVKFNPDPDKQHIFVAGCQDKKIIQWDTRTDQIVQEYDQHLGAVNTITFVDQNRRFVTTSDDKSIRVWDWDIPVVIKYIADPTLHSVPAASMHPNGKWWLGQSLDNQIVVYSATDRFRLNSKKNFRGHLVAGYACQVNASPDGRFIMSGDSQGKLFFWDWKSCKIIKSMKVHDQVTIGCEWHPHEPSKVATCSWDGTIKFWD